MEVIFRNINLLNTGLIVGCIILLLNLEPMLNYKPSIDVEPDSKLAVHEQHQQIEEESPQDKDVVEYGIIAEKNLFHPERKIIVKTAKAEPPSASSPPEEIPDLVLYGTVVTSKIRLAYLKQKNRKQSSIRLPRVKAKRQKKIEKEQSIFQIGETIGGFILKEITEGSVTLFRGEEKMVVQVFDPASPKKRTPQSVAKPAPPKTRRQPIRKPPPRRDPSVAQQIENKKKKQIMRRRRLLEGR